MQCSQEQGLGAPPSIGGGWLPPLTALVLLDTDASSLPVGQLMHINVIKWEQGKPSDQTLVSDQTLTLLSLATVHTNSTAGELQPLSHC